MSVNDPHSVFNNLITRYLSGELLPEEMEQFQNAVSADPDLNEQLEEYRKIWNSTEGVSPQQVYDLDTEWAALKHQIPSFDGVDVGAGNHGSSRRLLYYTYRIAAVLVVGLIFTFGLFYIRPMLGTSVVVAGNEPVELQLEDGTHVVLNRDSKIRFNKEFSEGERSVRLAGEAWFDVARDPSRPFVIDAGSALVEVLGTSFNVNAYKENPAVEITVETGVVALTAKQDQQEQIILKAGTSGTYAYGSKSLQIQPTADPNNLSWKTRDLYFENTPLNEAAKLVGRVYNVRIEIANQELAFCPITVTFSEQSLESVLSVLERTLDLEVSRAGDDILLDGPGCVE
jgi:transmembrane sensor